MRQDETRREEKRQRDCECKPQKPIIPEWGDVSVDEVLATQA